MPQIPIRTMLQLARPQRDRLPSSPRFVSARSQLYSQRLSECSSQCCGLASYNLVAEGCGDFRPSRAAPDIRGRRQSLSGSHSLSATVSSSLSATLSAESVSDTANFTVSASVGGSHSLSATGGASVSAYSQCFGGAGVLQSVPQSVLQSVLRSG